MENGQRNAARQQRENAGRLRCLKARPQQQKMKRKAKQKRRRKSQQHGETAHDNSPVASQSKGPLPGRQEMENELDSAGEGAWLLVLSRRRTQHAPLLTRRKCLPWAWGMRRGGTLSGVLYVHTVSGKRETQPWNLRLKARLGEMKKNQEE